MVEAAERVTSRLLVCLAKESLFHVEVERKPTPLVHECRDYARIHGHTLPHRCIRVSIRLASTPLECICYSQCSPS